MTEKSWEKDQSPEEKKKDNRKLYLGAIIALFLLLVAGGLYFYFENKELASENKATAAELSETYDKLDSVNTELDDKIREIEKLGGDVEDLKQAKEELEAEKEKIRETKNIQIADLQERLEGYTFLLKQKDKELEQLRSANEALFTENVQLKEEKNQLNQSISELEESKEDLNEKVELASRLKAENIKIAAVNQRGKEREGEFRNRHIDKLKVEFNLAKNDVAPIGGREIMIRITDPQGNPLFDVATGSGTFILDGKEEFYTAKQEILFDNSQQKLNFLYDKGTDYGEGTHTVKIYSEGYEIGAKRFDVK